MFLFVSTLVMTGLIEYLHQPWYVIIMCIYIYLLLLWPWIINFFDIRYTKINGRIFSYGTPISIFSAFIMVSQKSVSLRCLEYFLYVIESYSETRPIFIHRYNIFPSWYKVFLHSELLTSEGHSCYLDSINDRSLSAVMFWRYEKTYTSFICFNRLAQSDNYRFLLIYKFALDYRLYGAHIKEEDLNNMLRFLNFYIRIYFFFISEAGLFLNNPLVIYEYFFNTDDRSKEISNGYDYMVTKFYIDKTNVMKKEDILMEFSSTKRYRNMLMFSEFFWNYKNVEWPYMYKYINWFIVYIEYMGKLTDGISFKQLEEKGGHFAVFSIILQAYNNGYLIDDEFLTAFIEEYVKLFNENEEKNKREGILKKEDIEKLLKFR